VGFDAPVEAGSDEGVGPFFQRAGEGRPEAAPLGVPALDAPREPDALDDAAAVGASFFEESIPPGPPAAIEMQEFGSAPGELPERDDVTPERSEGPRPKVQHCPWCTGDLEPLPETEASDHAFRCNSCGRRFDIQIN